MVEGATGRVRACPYGIPDYEGKTPYKRYCAIQNGAPCTYRIVKCPYIQKLVKGMVAEEILKRGKKTKKAFIVEVYPKRLEKLKKLGVKIPVVVVEVPTPSY